MPSPVAVDGYVDFPANSGPDAMRSPACNYYTWDTLMHGDLWAELMPRPGRDCDFGHDRPEYRETIAIFDGWYWTRWTANHWEIPIAAATLYLLMIATLKLTMGPRNGGRKALKLTRVVLAWNFFLSAFSIAGMCYTVPRLLVGESGVLTAGWYASVCNSAASYGHGYPGLFVCLFIYSKLAELLDTFFLLVRKSPVIFLHWYHHLTVLLFCWHAYSARIGTGLWFAAMNYSVHGIMYAYFGLTQAGEGPKNFAKRFSMLITTLQLTQMVFGIAVTVSSVVYLSRGVPCYVSLFNSLLGLGMYASYFVLFLQLFLSHYVYNTKGAPPAAKAKHEPLLEPHCPPALSAAADGAAKARPVAGKRQSKEQ
mmetsp:Transcript_22362/g.71544  ORF Transcript_22362/g.71544 Transcript_22362/m.71544 type:complete len:367 (+) Transcript_22362:63-1163(+)